MSVNMKKKNKFAVALGALGGRATWSKKNHAKMAKIVAANGKKGGRPRNKPKILQPVVA